MKKIKMKLIKNKENEDAKKKNLVSVQSVVLSPEQSLE
jgi:hypothetical protein